MFADLLQHEGVREVVELRSAFGFLAFHGGALEQETDVIATEVARRGQASLYAVVHPSYLRWHVPSRLVTPDASPALARFLHHVEVVVALHGYGRPGRWTDILVGGRDRCLAHDLSRRLRPALPGYDVVSDLDRIPAELRGLHPDNPVNRARGGGVQLELPPRARGLGPRWTGWTRPPLPPPTEALVEALSGYALDVMAESSPAAAGRRQEA